jgi:hypothetical protein
MNITYLFGAGASAGNQILLNGENAIPNGPKFEPEGIPVVRNFNRDIEIFLEILKSELQTEGLIGSPDHKEKIQKIIGEFVLLFGEFKNLFSFDTYAKMLYEKGEVDKLILLKKLLRSYLTYRQNKVLRDKRYDLFFATLINKREISNNINFLSWNYDTQIEDSLAKFSLRNSMPTSTDFIQIPTFPEERKPHLIKLNGSITYDAILPSPDKAFRFVVGRYGDISALNLVKSLFENPNSDSLYFSFENSQFFNHCKTQLLKILNNTDVLVIIGYSFPTLNRKIDFQMLANIPKDKKILVQCRPEDYTNIKSRINSLLGLNNQSTRIEQIENIDEFYIPFEIDKDYYEYIDYSNSFKEDKSES